MVGKVVIAGMLTVVASLGVIIHASSPQPSTTGEPVHTVSEQVAPTAIIDPICDGTTITTDCAVDGVAYATYIYHPAVAEVSRTETVTTYRQEVSDYCTLCRDGTYSPSCATGRGACSHHGGVAQWNAPRYRNVPEYTTKTVIEAPAQPERYEKVPRSVSR